MSRLISRRNCMLEVIPTWRKQPLQRLIVTHTAAHQAMRASCGRRPLLRKQAASMGRPAAMHWCTAAGLEEGRQSWMCL